MSHDTTLNQICIDDIPYDLSNLLSQPTVGGDGSPYHSCSSLFNSSENGDSLENNRFQTQRLRTTEKDGNCFVRRTVSDSSGSQVSFPEHDSDGEDESFCRPPLERSRKSSFRRSLDVGSNDRRGTIVDGRVERESILCDWRKDMAKYKSPTLEEKLRHLRGMDTSKQKHHSLPLPKKKSPKVSFQNQPMIKEFSKVEPTINSTNKIYTFQTRKTKEYNPHTEKGHRQHGSSCGDNQRQHVDRPREVPMIEIEPGVKEPLRGAYETLNAIKEKNTAAIICSCCQVKISCIADAAYIICPTCRVVSPVPHGEWGVGLGYSSEELQTPMSRTVIRPVK